MSALPNVLERSLSTKVLALTILFILFAEVVVLIPSIANKRQNLLEMRIDAAYIVTVAMEAPNNGRLDQETAEQLFATANILGVTVNYSDTRMMVLAPTIDPHSNALVIHTDIREESFPKMIIDSWKTTFSPSNDNYLQVTGAPIGAPDMAVNIFVSENAIRNELREYAVNVFWLSLIISTLAGALVYWALNLMIIRPVKLLTHNMVKFEGDPEKSGAIHKPSSRRDEIGGAEVSLANMQHRLTELLTERRRLAALGSGISKITHDLRNILASAQLMSDRLAKSEDPSVRKLSPRLISALDRAIALSRDTLTYGGMDASKIQKEPLNFALLLEEIFDNAATMGVRMNTDVSEDFSISADRNQFYRCLFNLVKNAAEAIAPIAPNESDTALEAEHGSIDISVSRSDTTTFIEITDTGPGLPEHARDDIFEPFKGSKKPGGSGLGLAISAEIVRAHGGDIAVKRTDETGTTFGIELPN